MKPLIAVTVLLSAFHYPVFGADNWEKVQEMCDRGAHYEIEQKPEGKVYRISLSKSTSEEIFEIEINREQKIRSVVHVLRYYALTEELVVKPEWTGKIKATKITIDKAGVPQSQQIIGDGVQVLKQKEMQELLSRCKNLVDAIHSN